MKQADGTYKYPANPKPLVEVLDTTQSSRCAYADHASESRYLPVANFRVISGGRLHPYCRDCERAYNRKCHAAKRNTQ